MGDVKSVLFVCTGNSCRSVMAEGLMRKALKELGKDIKVASAGVRALTGLSPTDETIEVMAEEDADVSGFESKSLTDKVIEDSDLILVMENSHKEEVIRRVPGAASKTYLLKEFGHSDAKKYPQGADVPDPIGRPLRDYKTCLGVIKKEIDRIANLL